MSTIYTFGYQGQQLETLQAHVEHLNAVLLDIRFSPRSRNPIWSRKRLQQVFGGSYLHLPDLGNVNYRNGRAIQINNLNLGGAKVAAMMKAAPVVLLCVCANVHTCHRKVVADALGEKYGWTVEHL